jgi:UDP-N-acetylmuramoyl-L-alanyl-D-glutamate--2,6-diaminopimelate ligase
MFRKIVKAFIPRKLFKTIEPYGHLAESVLFNVLYGFPARNLKVIGVTGTDGKTTTTTMIWKLLEESGYKVGYMTTIGYGSHKKQRSNHVHMTTMQIGPMLKRIKELKAEGIEWLVLETTSHALAQNRVWGIPYSIAVMTNVNHEHLDYHGNFENYQAAKQRLFHLTGANEKGLQIGVVNADDPSSALFAGEVPHPLRYGINNGDIQAEQIETISTGSHYVVRRGDKALHINVNIPGSFNIYNSLAAVCVGIALDLSNEQISKGIDALKEVEGRMTSVEEGQEFGVVVDFAHTPDSFEKLLSDMRQQIKKPHRLIVMFGSAGRRDEKKRAIQGAIAGKYADLVVVTEEDDRDIDGMEIMNTIAGGAEQSGKQRGSDLQLIHDRVEAINYAIGQAKKGDVVMLLGKGHEKTIERAEGEHPWDEVGEAKKAIAAKRPAKKATKR